LTNLSFAAPSTTKLTHKKGASNLSNWFTISSIDKETYIISEYRHWEETHCYLLNGAERALIIDTGLGINNIHDEVIQLTDKPVVAAATHVHWDHIGGHKYFSEFYAHVRELDWLKGGFPLPVSAVKKMLASCCELPESFDLESYEIFQGTPTRVLKDGDTIDLGGRNLRVLHTPGHSPGHMCFWEADRGYLFTGDLAYIGTLFANYPSTQPESYLQSLEKVSALPVKKVFPAHHSLEISPQILTRMKNELTKLKSEGKLHHGCGTFDYGDWAISL